MESGQHDVNGLVNQARESFTDIKGSLNTLGNQASATAKQAYQDLRESGKEALETCSEKGRVQLRSIEQHIRENPVKSTLFALGLGIFISKFIKV